MFIEFMHISYLHVCVYFTCVHVSSDSRRRQQISWSWSYRKLCATCGCLEVKHPLPRLCESRRCSYPESHLPRSRETTVWSILVEDLIVWYFPRVAHIGTWRILQSLGHFNIEVLDFVVELYIVLCVLYTLQILIPHDLYYMTVFSIIP